MYLKINKKVVNIAAAILVATTTLLPLGEITFNNNETYTAGISNIQINNTKEEKIEDTANISIDSQIQEEENKEDIKAYEETQSIYLEPDSKNVYHVIVASDRQEVRLQEYLEKLYSEGYHEMKILKSNTMSRIVAGSFPTNREAYSFMNELKKKSNKFETSWIYKK